MKAKARSMVTLMLLTWVYTSGQVINRAQNIQPLVEGDNLKYGTDIIVHDDATQDQRNAQIGVAPNGWLFACYSLGTGGFQIAKSIDHGLTWSVSSVTQPGTICESLGLSVCGNDESDIRLFIATSSVIIPGRASVSIMVYTFDASMIQLGESQLHSMNDAAYHDVAIASDFPFPSSGASPYSIGVVFTTDSSPADTAIFMVSGDGGTTFSTRKVLGISWGKYGQVALAPGRSLDYPNGIYFAAIEEPTTGLLGKIWETHNQASFNSDFTFMVSMDDAAGLSNLCKNPSIACQHNNISNGIKGLSVAILFERFVNAGNYNIAGTSNKSPLGGGFWTRLDVTGNTKYNLQPDISFDPQSNKFLATYFDSTSQQLNYVNKSQELTDPSSWEIIKTGYNDQSNLTAPCPRVLINPVKQKAFHIWNGVRPGGNGMAVFEPEYSPTGIPGNPDNSSEFVRRVFPDPARDIIYFELADAGDAGIRISILDAVGKQVYDRVSGHEKGTRIISVLLTSLPGGIYQYVIRQKDQIGQGSFIILK